MAEPRILAVVPARGGSKRLPRKNLLPLAGRPLIGWTLDAAQRSGCFTDVLVSTDDAEIAATAQSLGALVPWLRPAALAGDTARSIDVVLHALDRYAAAHGEVDALMLLQPTSPFRRPETIRRAVAQFVAQGSGASVVSVSPAATHPAWTFSLDGPRLKPFCGWEPLNQRSQDLPAAYTLNGAIYLASAARLRALQSFFAEDMQALVMPDAHEGHDIDTEEDWLQAEHIARLELAGR